MVKIIDLEDDLVSEEDAESSDNDTTEEEDDGIVADIEEKPPDPPDTPEPPLSPDGSSALGPSTPEEAASPSLAPEDIRRRTLGPGIIPPSLRVGPTRYLWYVIAQYGHYVEFQRSLPGHGPIRPPGPDGLSRWAFELQQLAGPSNGHSDPEFICSITAPDTSNTPAESPTETNSEDNRETERVVEVPALETASHIDEPIDKEEGKTDSDESTKEKSNGVGEKEQLAATAAMAKLGLVSSPDLSDYELSDVSPPDYDTLQAELNKKCGSNKEIECSTTSLAECPWTTVKETCLEDLDPEIINSADAKKLSECSEEGEAACLPVHSIVKDCWEQWVDDDRLFNLAEDTPSTSAGVRMPSSASPITERHQVKIEKRPRARECERAAKPLERFIFVPTEKIGRILGKGGRRLKDLEKRTGAHIKIEHRRSNKPVTQLTLTGTDEQISKADEEICIIIRNFKPPKSGEATTASVSSQEELELKRLLIGIKNQVLDAEKSCRKS